MSFLPQLEGVPVGSGSGWKREHVLASRSRQPWWRARRWRRGDDGLRRGGEMTAVR